MVIQKILTPVYVYFEMRFIDTLGFLPASLETLTHNLQKDCKTIQEIQTIF